MQILYTGVTESELSSIISCQRIEEKSIGAGTMIGRSSCTGDDNLHIREALLDALERCDKDTKCYVLEVAVNETQVIDDDEGLKIDLSVPIDEVPGIALKSIIHVYIFELSYKLRLIGAIKASERAYTELSDRFGINYLGESQNAFLEWFWRLNVKEPVLGAKFFSITNIPVGGKVVPMNEIRETLRMYTSAVRNHADTVLEEDNVTGILRISGVGCVSIGVSHFLSIASPVTIAEVLRGNSREIVKYLEGVNPVCAMSIFAEELLHAIVPGNQFELSVDLDREEIERVLLETDPEKYALVVEAIKKLESLEKNL